MELRYSAWGWILSKSVILQLSVALISFLSLSAVQYHATVSTSIVLAKESMGDNSMMSYYMQKLPHKINSAKNFSDEQFFANISSVTFESRRNVRGITDQQKKGTKQNEPLDRVLHKSQIETKNTNFQDAVCVFKPDYDVLARFIEPLARNGGIRKTHLHLASRINWNLFMRYLLWLQENHFVTMESSHGQELYVLTGLGSEMFEKLEAFLGCFKHLDDTN